MLVVGVDVCLVSLDHPGSSPCLGEFGCLFFLIKCQLVPPRLVYFFKKKYIENTNVSLFSKMAYGVFMSRMIAHIVNALVMVVNFW